jgi:hypothetical protein
MVGEVRERSAVALMRKGVRALGLLAAGFVLGAVVVLGALFAGWPGPKPALPPLLKNVTAGGGWWGACPPENEQEAEEREGHPLATSPELEQRLVQSFPPGSNERKLVDTLSKQGFELLPPCKSDHSVRVAAFRQHGGGVLVFPVTANIFWKVDKADNIVWTRGFVAYEGL